MDNFAVMGLRWERLIFGRNARNEAFFADSLPVSTYFIGTYAETGPPRRWHGVEKRTIRGDGSRSAERKLGPSFRGVHGRSLSLMGGLLKCCILLVAWSPGLLRSECRIELPGLVYPPLARQARIQGSVQTRSDLVGGVIVEKPSFEGHPFLTAAVRAGLEGARWGDCADGEYRLRFEFALRSEVGGPSVTIEQTEPTVFRVSVARSDDCVYAIVCRKSRGWVFWKRKPCRCELSCPPF